MLHPHSDSFLGAASPRPGGPETTDHGPEADTIALASARGLGPASMAALRAAFTSDAAIRRATAAEMAARLNVPHRAAAVIASAIHAVDPWPELRRTRRGNAFVLGPRDSAWPPLLRLIDPGPPGLWCRGSPPAGDRTVAIVGARRAPDTACRRAGEIAGALTEDGWTVVSGGALGVDAAAHRGALRAGGVTIAVLGSGLARPAPASHARLFDEIVAAGGTVISEWPMETEARPWHFPRRNRVIAGIARAVLVVAAGERSGAHITARIAVEELSRDVGAFPGDPDDPMVAGCLRLLREGAAILRNADDVRELLAGTEHLAAAARALVPKTPAPTTPRPPGHSP